MDNSTKILVADDEKNMRVTLAAILEDKGYSITTADTGEKAVELCESEGFNIVIMDVRMPGMDGVEALKAIRAIDNEAAVMMITANQDKDTADQCMNLGVFDYVLKPFDFNYLETTVAAKIMLVT